MAKTVVLITGANQGIGFETAKLIATEHKDYIVLLAGRRQAAVEEAAKKLRAEGLAAEPLVLDVDSDESIAAAIKEIETRYGRLDVLVNNAAISGHGNLDKHGRDEWKSIFNTNVFGVASLTDAATALMKKSVDTNNPKRIVFVSSSLGSLTLKEDPKEFTHANIGRLYTTSKAALNMLAMHYMVEFENDPNWKINITCPGFCATGLNAYSGTNTAGSGAINSTRLATLGPDGPTGTYTNKEGSIPW